MALTGNLQEFLLSHSNSRSMRLTYTRSGDLISRTTSLGTFPFQNKLSHYKTSLRCNEFVNRKWKLSVSRDTVRENPNNAGDEAQEALIPSNGNPKRRDSTDLDCISTGIDVQCLVAETENGEPWAPQETRNSLSEISENKDSSILETILEMLLLISPFFFWGTAMVAMKDVLPKAGPLFVASVRLIPAGALLVGFAALKGRKMPKSAMSWLAISVFALVDGTCFQGCLAEGLRRTSAGLGSVIIDSQPLTVAVLAAFLFGEKIRPIGVLGLFLGVLGLCLLEVPLDAIQSFFFADTSALPAQLALVVSPDGQSEAPVPFSLWESGEWWMLLSAQSMAVGTVLVRWVCRYSDPIMATGWHMVLGGIPLLALSFYQQDPAVTGHIGELSLVDWSSLLYTSLFGSAISYGVFFYNANKGNLTRLSSLTFLTPMFAAFFGYFYLGETLNSLQLFGALVTIVAILFVNYKPSESTD